ncbi:hypothetical protein D5F01_LYC18319 [Larimichthys crocea]|uniref:Uncharacterized protein n=2 Tax=Larimichthys crocea TaxID=215358 RepID=A0ACD3R8G4_LARCR|nr:hypothetical protein D5F01_LYC18319 [Larimichthys crocea]TMS15703.1 hypothetical protein E3U43_022165 [Larimichthys crocea]
MTKKKCPVGQYWDNLVSSCINRAETRPEPEPPTEPPVVVQLKSTVRSAQADSMMELSPALWICVTVATVGSFVALVVWFVIYRRKTSLRNAPEDAEAQQEPLQKTEPPAILHSLPSESNSHAEMLQRAAGALSPCPHLHLGAQTVSQWEEGFTAYRDITKHAGTEGGRGLPPCSTMREHRIPLPATELGGTALVTTKTM